MSRPPFWVLNRPAKGSPQSWVTSAHRLEDFEAVICPADDGHNRQGKRVTPLTVTVYSAMVTDIVQAVPFYECFLTDRVVDLFQSNGFTGFEVKPVEAVSNRTTDRKPPRLWELVVTGWGGVAPPESGVKLLSECPDCGCMFYSRWTKPGRLIDPSQWDGSDFFVVWPLMLWSMFRQVFVTDRVARAIREHGITGVGLTAQGELPVSREAPPLVPGRLSYYMPEARAREVGEPLGIY